MAAMIVDHSWSRCPLQLQRGFDPMNLARSMSKIFIPTASLLVAKCLREIQNTSKTVRVQASKTNSSWSSTP